MNPNHIYFDGVELIPHIAYYAASGVAMAMVLETADTHEQYCTATVYLSDDIGNDTIMPKGCAFIDANNIPGLVETLEEQGFGKPYKRFGEPVMGYSGWCEYPLFEFDLEKLRTCDPEGMKKYEEQYPDAFAKVREALTPDENFGGYLF